MPKSHRPYPLEFRQRIVELLWGNLKGRDLANLCPAGIGALRSPVRAGRGRIPRQPALAFAFLQHAGLGL